MTSSSISTNRGGFTLLEVLVAVAILGASMAVLLAAVNRSLVLNFESKSLLIADNLAQRKIAEIELEGFPRSRVDAGEFEEEPGYGWTLVIEPVDLPGIEASVMLVQLTILWDNGNEQFDVSYAVANVE